MITKKSCLYVVSLCFLVCGALFFSVEKARTLDCEPENPLDVVSDCSPDFEIERIWTVFNKNDDVVKFRWCLKGQVDPDLLGNPICSGINSEKWGPDLFVGAQDSLKFATPAVGGENIIEIYVSGSLNDEEASIGPCDCANEPDGSRVEDEDGECCLPEEIDQCNICYGPGPDLCGVCDGSNECLDCLGVPNGGAVYDDDDVCCLPEQIDACGKCFGPGPDKCGVCGGKNECIDCEGVPFGGKVVDECGVCGGDNSSCLCTESVITVDKKRVRKSARTLVKRTKTFAGRGDNCGGSAESYSRMVNKSVRLYKKIMRLMDDNFSNVVLECAEGVCTEEITIKTKTKMESLTLKLGNNAKATKVHAITDCKMAPHAPDDRPRSDDYTATALKSITNLPSKVSNCD